jgi:hypothetical protein
MSDPCVVCDGVASRACRRQPVSDSVSLQGQMSTRHCHIQRSSYVVVIAYGLTFVFGQKLLPCFEIALHFAIVAQFEYEIDVVLVLECAVELKRRPDNNKQLGYARQMHAKYFDESTGSVFTYL